MEPINNKNVFGNFTTLPGREAGYPLDQECLAMLQNNCRLLAVIAALQGNNYIILTGCGAQGNRKPGYVYIRRSDDLIGEILYYDGSAPSSTMLHIVETKQDIEANSVTYSEAYTERYLAGGPSPDGSDTFSWSSFSQEKILSLGYRISALNSQLSDLQTTVSRITGGTVPVGNINPFGGSQAPDGWLLCDGTTYSSAKYPELAAVLGVTSAQFVVPDLRGRFLVGLDPYDLYFNTLGEPNAAYQGAKQRQFTLTEGNIPQHYHTFWADDGLPTVNGTVAGQNNNYDCTSRTDINTAKLYKTSTYGYVSPDAITVKTLPPYYVVNYIIRAK